MAARSYRQREDTHAGAAKVVLSNADKALFPQIARI